MKLTNKDGHSILGRSLLFGLRSNSRSSYTHLNRSTIYDRTRQLELEARSARTLGYYIVFREL